MGIWRADAAVDDHEIAACLSSTTVSIDGDCKISLAASTDNAFVPAMWSSDSGSYKQYKLCPSSSSKAVAGADVPASLILAFNGYIYGFNAGGTAALKSSGVTGVTFPAAGKVQVAIGASNLVYAIQSATTTTSFGTNAVVSDGTGFTATVEYQDSDNKGIKCDDGRYGLLVGDIKLCPLCPVGTSGDGDGCTACSAGFAYGAVGLTTSCDVVGNKCAAGSYAQEGEPHPGHAGLVCSIASILPA